MRTRSVLARLGVVAATALALSGAALSDSAQAFSPSFRAGFYQSDFSWDGTSANWSPFNASSKNGPIADHRLGEQSRAFFYTDGNGSEIGAIDFWLPAGVDVDYLGVVDAVKKAGGLVSPPAKTTGSVQVPIASITGVAMTGSSVLKCHTGWGTIGLDGQVVLNVKQASDELQLVSNILDSVRQSDLSVSFDEKTCWVFDMFAKQVDPDDEGISATYAVGQSVANVDKSTPGAPERFSISIHGMDDVTEFGFNLLLPILRNPTDCSSDATSKYRNIRAQLSDGNIVQKAVDWDFYDPDYANYMSIKEANPTAAKAVEEELSDNSIGGVPGPCKYKPDNNGTDQAIETAHDGWTKLSVPAASTAGRQLDLLPKPNPNKLKGPVGVADLSVTQPEGLVHNFAAVNKRCSVSQAQAKKCPSGSLIGSANLTLRDDQLDYSYPSAKIFLADETSTKQDAVATTYLVYDNQQVKLPIVKGHYFYGATTNFKSVAHYEFSTEYSELEFRRVKLAYLAKIATNSADFTYTPSRCRSDNVISRFTYPGGSVLEYTPIEITGCGSEPSKFAPQLTWPAPTVIGGKTRETILLNHGAKRSGLKDVEFVAPAPERWQRERIVSASEPGIGELVVSTPMADNGLLSGNLEIDPSELESIQPSNVDTAVRAILEGKINGHKVQFPIAGGLTTQGNGTPVFKLRAFSDLPISAIALLTDGDVTKLPASGCGNQGNYRSSFRADPQGSHLAVVVGESDDTTNVSSIFAAASVSCPFAYKPPTFDFGVSKPSQGGTKGPLSLSWNVQHAFSHDPGRFQATLPESVKLEGTPGKSVGSITFTSSLFAGLKPRVFTATLERQKYSADFKASFDLPGSSTPLEVKVLTTVNPDGREQLWFDAPPSLIVRSARVRFDGDSIKHPVGCVTLSYDATVRSRTNADSLGGWNTVTESFKNEQACHPEQAKLDGKFGQNRNGNEATSSPKKKGLLGPGPKIKPKTVAKPKKRQTPKKKSTKTKPKTKARAKAKSKSKTTQKH